MGSSFLPSDILAAYLWAQLEIWPSIVAKRKQIWSTYMEGIQSWATNQGVQLPHVPHQVEQSYHMFYLVFPTLEERTRFISHLKEKGIHAVFHYQALHCSPMGLKLGGKKGQCPISEKMSDQLVRLPFYNSMTEEEQWKIVEAVLEFKTSKNAEYSALNSLAA